MKTASIVFVAHGSYGDVNPLIGIAKRLSSHNTVTFVANEYFREHVEREGLSFVQAGTIEEHKAVTETDKINGDTFKGAMSHYHIQVGNNYSRVYDIIKKIYSENRYTFVVTHNIAGPAIPVCEKYEIPVIMTYYSPSITPEYKEDYIFFYTHKYRSEYFARYILYPLYKIKKSMLYDMTDAYNGYRMKIGVPRIGSGFKNTLRNLLIPFSKYYERKDSHLNIVSELILCPNWFCEPTVGDTEHMVFCGFPFEMTKVPDGNNIIADNFIRKYGAPLVFTPGTAVADMDEFCKVIKPVCEALNAPAILLAKHGEISFDRYCRGGDAKILFLDYLDLGYLLPKSKLIVHHGGIGTVAQAIKAGIPQIIRPRMYDQPQNALRVAINGLGGILYPNAYSARSIIETYNYLSSSELHQSCIQHYSDSVNQENGTDNAAEIILDITKSYFDENRSVDLDVLSVI